MPNHDAPAPWFFYAHLEVNRMEKHIGIEDVKRLSDALLAFVERVTANPASDAELQALPEAVNSLLKIFDLV